MANKVAVAERADITPLDRINSDTDFPYGFSESAGERMVQAVSRWAGIAAFVAALGGLGVWLIG